MDIILGNSSIQIDPNFEYYNALHKIFASAAITAAENFEKKYWSYGNITKLWNSYPDELMNSIKSRCDYVCQILFERGIYDVTTDWFISAYYEKYFYIEDRLEPISNQLFEIAEYSEELKAELASKKANRGRWVGGGFGWKGAVQGAITAGTFNAASGVVHGVFDFFKDVSNDMKVKNLESKIYNDTQTVIHLTKTIYECNYNCFFGLISELIKHNKLKSINFEVDKIRAMSKNAVKYETDTAKLQDFLSQCLCTNPYDVEIYKYISIKMPQLSGFDNFASFFGMGEIYKFQLKLDAYPYLLDFDRLSENTLEEKCQKLRKGFDLQNKFGVDLDDKLSELLASIVSGECDDYSRISKLIYLLEKYLTSEQLARIEELYEVLLKKQESLRQTNEFKSIIELPEDGLKSIVLKINALFDYSQKYTFKIDEDLLRLAEKSVKYISVKSDIDYILNTINSNALAIHKTLNALVEACKYKRIMYAAENNARVDNDICMFSNLLEIVEKARSGNLSYQQKSIFAFMADGYENLKDKVIQSLKTAEEKNAFLQLKANIENIIPFIFDKPEQYQFDLFMRMRLTAMSDCEEDYYDCMSGFENSECIPAQFEYAKSALKFKNDTSDSLFEIIKKCAKNGYYPAINYVLENATICNLTREEKLYYSIIKVDPLSPQLYITFYNFNLLSSLLDRKAFACYKDAEATCALLYSGNLNSIKSLHIGYKNGDNAEISSLKRNKKIFNYFDKKEVAYFSFDDLDFGEDFVFLFTDKGFYFKFDFNGDSGRIKYDSSISSHNQIFKNHLNWSVNSYIIWQTYSLFAYSHKNFEDNLDEKELLYMALCGNPMALCKLLQCKNLSDDRREILNKIKSNISNSGKHYNICPCCCATCDAEDVFCPECGTKTI